MATANQVQPNLPKQTGTPQAPSQQTQGQEPQAKPTSGVVFRDYASI